MSTKITYNSTTTEVANGKIATLSCNGKKMKSDIVVEVPSAEDSAIPIEVSTEAEMTALLESGEVGGVYKYTGTTGTYENGALYVLEEEVETYTITVSTSGTVSLTPSSSNPTTITTGETVTLTFDGSGNYFDIGNFSATNCTSDYVCDTKGSTLTVTLSEPTGNVEVSIATVNP